MLWIMHISHVKGRYSQENEICHRTVTTIQITRWCPHPTLVGGCVWHVHKFDKKIILKGPQQHWKAQRYWIAVGHSVCPTILYGLPTKKIWHISFRIEEVPSPYPNHRKKKYRMHVPNTNPHTNRRNVKINLSAARCAKCPGCEAFRESFNAWKTGPIYWWRLVTV